MDFGNASALPAGGQVFGPGRRFTGRPPTRAEQEAQDAERRARDVAVERQVQELTASLGEAFADGPYASLLAVSRERRLRVADRRHDLRRVQSERDVLPEPSPASTAATHDTLRGAPSSSISPAPSLPTPIGEASLRNPLSRDLANAPPRAPSGSERSLVAEHLFTGRRGVLPAGLAAPMATHHHDSRIPVPPMSAAGTAHPSSSLLSSSLGSSALAPPPEQRALSRAAAAAAPGAVDDYTTSFPSAAATATASASSLQYRPPARPRAGVAAGLSGMSGGQVSTNPALLPPHTSKRKNNTSASSGTTATAATPAAEDKARAPSRAWKPLMRASPKPRTLADMPGARKLPRGAALARAAAVAQNALSLSVLPRPPDSRLDPVAFQRQDRHALDTSMESLRRELFDLRRGGLGTGTVGPGLLDPEVDRLLESLPPIAAPGLSPRVDKIVGVAPRLLGDVLTPLQREQQRTRLSGGVRQERRMPCALCRHPFARVNLVTPVTRKAVFDVVDAWQASSATSGDADPTPTLTPAAARREALQRVAPQCYEVVRICRFCTQFFPTAAQEADRAQLDVV